MMRIALFPAYKSSDIGGVVVSQVKHRRILWWWVGFGRSFVECRCGTRHGWMRNSDGTNKVRTFFIVGTWSISYCRLWVSAFGKLSLWDQAKQRRAKLTKECQP